MTIGALDLRSIAERAARQLVASGAYTPPPLPELPDMPIPYPLQAEIIGSTAKRKVIAAGRQVGKTIMASMLALDYFKRGKRVLLTSTSKDQADTFWQYITAWIAPLLDDGLYKNESVRLLKYRGGQLRVKTGRQPDALRGGKADLLILDECAWLNPTAWGTVGSPMLMTTNGDAVFISSPNRRNWFFELFMKAQADDSGIWAAWNFSSHENPYISEEAMLLQTKDMTEDDYKQEILAQFLEGDGSVFRYVTERCTAQRATPYKGRFVAGVDFAQSKDYTVMVVIDADSRRVVDYDRFRQADWSTIRGRLGALASKWGVERMICESNAAGAPNIEAMRNDGLPVVSFATTAQSKPPLIESLVLAFDRAEITVLDDEIMRGELMAYERRVSNTGRSQYSAPEGLHDDCVMALALAWHGAILGGRLFLFDEDEAA